MMNKKTKKSKLEALKKNKGYKVGYKGYKEGYKDGKEAGYKEAHREYVLDKNSSRG